LRSDEWIRADSFQALPYRNKQPFSIYDKSYGEALALVGPLIAAKKRGVLAGLSSWHLRPHGIMRPRD